ncbi:hypothetical protein PINS_up006942 [Pythium insidiosum]|nr:hypothetical protein PINS_up006942 [Pythium insidiosum]
MKLLSIVVFSACVLSTAVEAALDNSVCIYKEATSQCTPAAICGSQPRAGDSTLAQSCRLLANADKRPQQVHLAYAGETGTGMTISWATASNVADSSIWIGSSPTALTLRGDVKVSSTSYYSEGDYTLFQNHATVTGLTPNTQYYYQVGSSSDASARSEVSFFTTARAASDITPFEIGVYGDLGFGEKGEASTEVINKLTSKWSFVYHVGDIGYADDDFLVPSQALGFYYEKVYNKWMNSMTPLMSKLPYMVTVGNHEAECHSPACQVSSYKRSRLGNYTAYNARFKMPSRESQGNGNFGNQLAWLEADLKKAAANRANVPWLIVGMHRPMYHRKDTDGAFNPTGDSLAIQKAFEELFIKYGVDLVIAGHEHGFERHLPIARSKAVKDGVSADKKIYSNPKAPVYIVTGGPGNPEPNGLSGKNGDIPWNVLERAEYGISTMKVTRNSLTLKYITTDTNETLDEFAIVKN